MVEQAQRTAVCPLCASAQPPGARFCGGCGATLPAVDGEPATRTAAPPSEMGSAPEVAGRTSRLAPLLALLALAAVCLVGPLLWLGVVGDGVPGFATVLDFKIALATLVLILAVLQPLLAAVFYGWLRLPWPSTDAVAFAHRWNGRLLLPVAALVAFYCVRDIGPQASPTRAAVHSVLGSAVFVVLAAKLVILRGVPRLSALVPVLGVAVSLLFIGLWLSSAFFALRSRAQSYTNAEVGATAGIVTDARTVGRFNPAEVRVRVGQAVEWVNRADAPHNVVREGGGFDSGLIAPGGSFRWPAKSAGVFSYRCTIHPGMAVARIVVEDK